MKILLKIDRALGEPQLNLHERLITAVFSAFLMPYVWLGVILSLVGIMTPFIYDFQFWTWLASLTLLCVGFISLLRYLHWNDEKSKDNHPLDRTS